MVFLVVLFFIKNGLPFKNKSSGLEVDQKNLLLYGDSTVADLINKDTDQDGVLDWEEPLWGLDPTKKETIPGVPDITTVNKLKAEEGMDENNNTENLTETDKFARELFSTIATLNQNGVMDQTTVDKISASLAEKIQNPVQKKVYTLADLKIIQNDSVAAVKKYNDSLDYIIEKKYPIKGNVIDILQRFLIDENNVDASVLVELDPIIEQRNKIIDAIVKTNVPESLSLLHLDFINTLQKLSENLSAIKLFETDPIVALGGISQFEENITLLESVVDKLKNAIQKKLNT
jgi:hypothetical protein